jgi:hypothetical protein
MTTCNGRPTKPRTAAGRGRDALAKVVADVEDLAGELALAYDMEAPHLPARRAINVELASSWQRTPGRSGRSRSRPYSPAWRGYAAASPTQGG